MLTIKRPLPISRIRLLIFDLDGTLVDSGVDLANSVNAMLRHLHRPEKPVGVIKTYLTEGMHLIASKALGETADDQLVNDAVQFFVAFYDEHKLDNTSVYPGMFATLNSLYRSTNGTARKLAVLSNKPVNLAREIVKALGLDRYFFQVYGGDSFHAKKPDPVGAYQLAQEAGTRSEETVIVGDSHNDILTARNAGMWSIGAGYGFVPFTFESTPPDVLVAEPEEIAMMFEHQVPSH